ncbi:MAG: hypothetical protein BGP24_07690 [Lysobacterales bacterium 69-70]|nr:carbon storage regulator CsrA [Xanthomonadaceae bacterium]OJY93648.1 MAG: hypothetical protein BGP24_07690 [Xanthomonadales bacterium 69-70]
MLILSRDETELLRIGDDIAIHVLRILGSSVRLGIDAPRDIPVHREEVYRRIRAGSGRRSTPGSLPGVGSHRAVDLSALPGFR